MLRVGAAPVAELLILELPLDGLLVLAGIIIHALAVGAPQPQQVFRKFLWHGLINKALRQAQGKTIVNDLSNFGNSKYQQAKAMS